MGNAVPDHFSMTTVTEDLDWKKVEEKEGFLRRQRQEIESVKEARAHSESPCQNRKKRRGERAGPWLPSQATWVEGPVGHPLSRTHPSILLTLDEDAVAFKNLFRRTYIPAPPMHT